MLKDISIGICLYRVQAMADGSISKGRTTGKRHKKRIISGLTLEDHHHADGIKYKTLKQFCIQCAIFTSCVKIFVLDKQSW